MRDVSLSDKTSLLIAVLGVVRPAARSPTISRKAGHYVMVVARPASQRFQQLSRDQAIVLQSDEKARARVADALDKRTACDLIVLNTHDYQVDALLPSLQRRDVCSVHVQYFQP